MTSDTCSKECAVSFSIGGRTVTIGAMAKGAGMIHPNMATMLACVTTDAAIDKKTLQRVTHDAVDMTFNRISVDGDTSTNDTVLVLANGAAGNETLTADHDDLPRFKTALFLVLKKMARMIIEDGEGISHVVDVRITGAANAMDAKRIAEGMSRSPLVKTSWCGGDPNWGRLMDVLGYCGARVREELVDIYYDGLLAVKGGVVGPTPLSRLRRIVAKRHFTITIDLHLGKGDYNLLVNDLTEQYVVLNKGE
jgi:glutamate N-acetyltransferase/amino-acid N-acetyltransferase